MKNLSVIEELYSIMESVGVSLEDLIAFSNNKSQEKFKSASAKKLPLEVLYSDGSRSFCFEPLKIPVAIICGNIGIAFEDAPETMDWSEADEYCEQYSVGDKKWQLPNKEAGHLLLLYNNKDAINMILTVFGKEPLKKRFYWSSSDFGCNSAWCIGFGKFYMDRASKNNTKYVRPILIF